MPLLLSCEPTAIDVLSEAETVRSVRKLSVSSNCRARQFNETKRGRVGRERFPCISVTVWHRWSLHPDTGIHGFRTFCVFVNLGGAPRTKVREGVVNPNHQRLWGGVGRDSSGGTVTVGGRGVIILVCLGVLTTFFTTAKDRCER